GLTTKQYDRLKAQAENMGLESISEYAKIVLAQALNAKVASFDAIPVQAAIKISKSQEEQNETEVHWIKPSLKLNAVETAFLREAADYADMSISAFIRLALLSHLTKTSILTNE